MRNTILLICSLCCLLFTACAVRNGPSEESIESKRAGLEELSRGKIVQVHNGPYLGANPVRMPKNMELSSGVFAKKITLNRRGSLADLCGSITDLTGIPIMVSGNAAKSAATVAMPGSKNLDAELRDALGDVPKKVQSLAPAPRPTSTQPAGMRVKYSGTVKGLLDILAARSGLSWEYSPQTGVSFAAVNSKTFTIWAAPGKIGFSNKITNESKDDNGSSSSGSSRQDSSIQTAQTNTTELVFDVWKDVETEVKGLLSSSGSVSINQAAGTITVKDNPQILQQVERYVAELNEKLSRQIALSIKVWSLEIEDSSDVGINLGMFFESPDVKVFAGASPLQFAAAGGELSAAIVNGKLKDSTALLKGLRSVGKATQVTSGGGVVMSNQPVPVQAIRRESYLASTSRSDTDYGQTTELVPGEVTTGFAMTVIPHILERRRVVLQYTVNLSSLDDITEFSSGDSTIQLPKVSTRSFSQRMTLKMGQTLVLAGFEQEMDGKNTSGGFLGIGRSRQYTKSLIVITISTEAGDV